MAKADMKMPEDFLLRISRLGNKADGIIASALEAGGEVVEAKVRSNLQGVVGRNTREDSRSTGQLVSALGVSPVKKGNDGEFNVKVGFSEPRSDGMANARIAGILEYGKSGQPARPFMKPAKSSSKAACIQSMQDRFEQEVKSI